MAAATDNPSTPNSPAALPQAVRLEMLIGHLADALAPADELVKALRLQANASVTTRSRLEFLIELTGGMYTVLRDIRAHVEMLEQRKP